MMVDDTIERRIVYCVMNTLDRPPDGCLQYFTGTSGTFTTFNFESTDSHFIVVPEHK